MRIAATSDLHGHLPEVPDCDVLCIAGDIGRGDIDPHVDAAWWTNTVDGFLHWLHELRRRNIVVIGVAGNHDFILEHHGHKFADLLPWIYLQDESIELGGVKFHGTPWQRWQGGWAFNSPEVDPGEEFLREKFALIPDDTDVLIAHVPPAGFHDRVGRSNVGSIALNRRIEQICPTLAVYGHIHHGYGVEQVDTGEYQRVTLANVSHTAVVDGRYVPQNAPVVFDV